MCPACGTTSARVHSRYVRRLADSAVGGRPVVIELRVRRFRCRQGACPQKTFAEQVEGLTFQHGRRSAGLQSVLEQLRCRQAAPADCGCPPNAADMNGRFPLIVDTLIIGS
ncbi:transposase family protein [Streptomyces sp. NPDC058239]|uniref:transposase family protein n=1 Tax=Streptomyces sp. NPDC058239 TaxID=3346395 RepID=UPI0036EAF5E0